MDQIHGQTCDGMNEYQECGSYSGCLCFHQAYSPNTTICVDGFLLSCSELIQCDDLNYKCTEPEYECIYHRQCYDYPVCYPVPSYNPQFCLPPSKKKQMPSITLVVGGVL